MKYECTKIEKILEVNNEMVHNFYYLYYGRIYTNDRKKFLKFKYIQMFDVYDLQDFFNKDVFTQKDIREYAKYYAYSEIIENYIFNIKDEYDITNIQKLLSYCNEAINIFNESEDK